MFLLSALPLLASCWLALAHGHAFRTIYAWKQLDFVFPNDSVREAYLASGDYIPENNLPLGLSVWRERMFITVPRWKKGVPSNLNYLLINETGGDGDGGGGGGGGGGSPRLTPYPDLASNSARSPDGIVNVFRARVDACDRLWAVDTGLDDILGSAEVVRPMRLLVIDLHTDKIVRSYPLKDSDQKPDSFFADLVVDVEREACDDAFAYLSDLGGYGLVVYSWANNDSWRINHNYFYFDPLNGDYNVSGFNFQWTDGVFGMSLSPRRRRRRRRTDGHDGSHRTLYFHAMSGVTEFQVSTEILRDERAATSNNYYAFRVAGQKGPLTQGTSSVIDEDTGVDYLTQVNRNGLACWDTRADLTPHSFVLVAQDNVTMVFPNDLSIDPTAKRLYVLADNMPKFYYSALEPNETNFFVSAANLSDLTALCSSAGTA